MGQKPIRRSFKIIAHSTADSIGLRHSLQRPFFKDWNPEVIPPFTTNNTAIPSYHLPHPDSWLLQKTWLRILERSILEDEAQLIVLDSMSAGIGIFNDSTIAAFEESFAATISILPEEWFAVHFFGSHFSAPTKVAHGLARISHFAGCAVMLFSRVGVSKIYNELLANPKSDLEWTVMSMMRQYPHFYAPEILPLAPLVEC